jgi:hypothetical protein
LVEYVHKAGHGAGGAEATLKITLHQQPAAVIIQLEGRLAGPWVSELEQTWWYLSPSLGRKQLVLDLREVTFADPAGRELLIRIFDRSHNRFLADTPLTKYLAEQAVKPNGRNGTTSRQES